MPLRIERADGIGFCFGVRRALDILEKAARVHKNLETLGAVVHNQPVLDRLAEIGVRVVGSVKEILGDTVITSSHGVSPQLEEEIRSRNIKIIDTTCPFVKRAHSAARRLAEYGCFVVIYGDADHIEVKGILGWVKEKGMATVEEKPVLALDPLPRRIGILSQTTKIPANFTEFVKNIVDGAFARDSELHVVDTICHDIRQRQSATIALANKVDVMIVVGGHNSSNTNQLAKLCSAVTKTYLVETGDEIQPSWFKGKEHVGITAGASTDERSIDEVVNRLEAISQTKN